MPRRYQHSNSEFASNSTKTEAPPTHLLEMPRRVEIQRMLTESALDLTGRVVDQTGDARVAESKYVRIDGTFDLDFCR